MCGNSFEVHDVARFSTARHFWVGKVAYSLHYIPHLRNSISLLPIPIVQMTIPSANPPAVQAIDSLDKIDKPKTSDPAAKPKPINGIDPNGFFSGATLLEPFFSKEEKIGGQDLDSSKRLYNDREDYFRINFSQNRSAVFMIGGSVQGKIYNANRQLIYNFGNSAYGEAYADSQEYSQGVAFTGRGTYYLRIDSYSSFKTAYRVRVDSAEDPDGWSGGAEQLGAIEDPRWRSNQIGNLDFFDYKQFYPVRDGNFSFSVNSRKIALDLYEDSQNGSGQKRLIASAKKTISNVYLKRNQNYFLRVGATGDNISLQDYTVKFTPPKPQSLNQSGTSSDDEMLGDLFGDTLRGKGGNDQLLGKTGNDRLLGDLGNDRLLGGNGNDVLLGGQGKDWLVGGEGNDVLRGGKGEDWLTGEAGVDAFFLEPGAGKDRIVDFIDGVDRLYLSKNTTFESLTIQAQGANTLIQVGGTSIALLQSISSSLITIDDFSFFIDS
jgi:hypothetical protein